MRTCRNELKGFMSGSILPIEVNPCQVASTQGPADRHTFFHFLHFGKLKQSGHR
jgi:hypothetical protein